MGFVRIARREHIIAETEHNTNKQNTLMLEGRLAVQPPCHNRFLSAASLSGQPMDSHKNESMMVRGSAEISHFNSMTA